ncbi:MAG: DNA internalization-related competence protein ComEC/Rec2 [Lachnospiraceae bacterium]|nr:DNA internalization-related competence protein ComEC/Rec2 [Lachnospiraceae bacterium]
MALWMTVEQEVFGLAAMLLVFSCAFVRGFVRGRGGEKSRRPAFFVWVDRKFWKGFWKRKVMGELTVVGTSVMVIGCLAGVWRMEWEQGVVRREETLVQEFTGQEVLVEGVVEEIGETDYGSRLVLRECEIYDAGLAVNIGVIRKLYGYVDTDEGLKLGMKVRIFGELELPEADRNPGGFDFRLYCLAKGICGIVSGEQAGIVDSRYLIVQEGLRQIGLLLEQRLELIADEDDVGILKAVLLGDKGDVDGDIYELYQKNGISHVLAISGLHVSVIGMGLWKGLRKAGVGYWSAGALAFVMLFCFGSIAGFGPSVVRAVFMMGISFLAGAFGRTYDLPSAMSVPGMGILLWNPYVLTQASFQLSFLAVFAIFFPGGYLAKAWKVTGLWQNVLTSASIQLVTLPVVLYHSFEIPVYSIVLNLFVVPLMTYVLVSGILGLAGSFLWMPFGTFLLGGAHYILALYELACRGVGQFLGAYLVLGRPSFWAMAAYYGCLLFGTWMGAGKRKMAVLCLVGALFLVPVPQSGLLVTFLDVGQGDGILVQAGERTLLVDCGSSQEKAIGEDCLVPFLKSRGIDRLGAVAVTHGDMDHISGVQYLLEEPECGIAIERLILPASAREDEACGELAELAARRGILVSYMDTGTVRTVETMEGGENGQLAVSSGESEAKEEPELLFSEVLGDGIFVQCLYPEPNTITEDKNEGSLVLMLEYGSFRMLLTGDIGMEGEQRMEELGLLRQVTVLKAGHHGSKTSTSQALLDAVRPAYVVFSYGQGNRYGHPAEEVVERCVDSGAAILETAKSGAIEVWTDGKFMQIRGWLDRQDGI